MRVKTTLTIDEEVIDEAKKAGINISEAAEAGISSMLGLTNDVTKLANREAKIRAELDLIEKQKVQLEFNVKEQASKSQMQKDTEVMLRAWKRKLNGEFNYFAKVLHAFCAKYNLERFVVLDFLEGKRKELSFGQPKDEQTECACPEVVL